MVYCFASRSRPLFQNNRTWDEFVASPSLLCGWEDHEAGREQFFFFAKVSKPFQKEEQNIEEHQMCHKRCWRICV